MTTQLSHDCPDEGDNPADERPTKEDVDENNSQEILVVPHDGDDGGKEVEDKPDNESDDAKDTAEEPSDWVEIQKQH
jgi:hypothetical protein